MSVDLYHVSLGVRPITVPPNHDAAPCVVCKRMITRHEASTHMNCCSPCYLAGNGPAAFGYDQVGQLKCLTTPWREFSRLSRGMHPRDEEDE